MSWSCWCITGAGEHWPIKYISMLGTQGKLSQRNNSYLFTISVPNSAKQHAIPLPAVHALSGYDTNIAIYRLGKGTAYSALTKNAGALQSLEAFHDVHTFLDTARRFVLLMHGKKA